MNGEQNQSCVDCLRNEKELQYGIHLGRERLFTNPFHQCDNDISEYEVKANNE
jgi:hypothetical protein